MVTEKYEFGSGSFQRVLWLNRGQLFRRPEVVSAEFTTPGEASLLMADVNGKVTTDVPGSTDAVGWRTFHIPSSDAHLGEYKLGFANRSEAEMKVRQGVVRLL